MKGSFRAKALRYISKAFSIRSVYTCSLHVPFMFRSCSLGPIIIYLYSIYTLIHYIYNYLFVYRIYTLCFNIFEISNNCPKYVSTCLSMFMYTENDNASHKNTQNNKNYHTKDTNTKMHVKEYDFFQNPYFRKSDIHFNQRFPLIFMALPKTSRDYTRPLKKTSLLTLGVY